MLGVIQSNSAMVALIKERLGEPERLKEYGSITLEQVEALARSVGYSDEVAAAAYQMMQAVAATPIDQLARRLYGRGPGKILKFERGVT